MKEVIIMDEKRRFVELANPHAWLLTADNLHQQATCLYSQKERNFTRITDIQTGKMMQFDDVNKSVFLLGGFALENAIKAFLVYENPTWISNGRIARQLKSHSLLSLQSRSRKIPFKNRYLWVLDRFENGLESWARYPCSLTVEDSRIESELKKELWVGYVRLMQAYGNCMIRLLSKGWSGPHGFDGYWEISKNFLEMTIRRE